MPRMPVRPPGARQKMKVRPTAEGTRMLSLQTFVIAEQARHPLQCVRRRDVLQAERHEVADCFWNRRFHRPPGGVEAAHQRVQRRVAENPACILVN